MIKQKHDGKQFIKKFLIKTKTVTTTEPERRKSDSDFIPLTVLERQVALNPNQLQNTKKWKKERRNNSIGDLSPPPILQRQVALAPNQISMGDYLDERLNREYAKCSSMSRSKYDSCTSSQFKKKEKKMHNPDYRFAYDHILQTKHDPAQPITPQ